MSRLQRLPMGLAFGIVLVAQPLGAEPILHEYVPPPGSTGESGSRRARSGELPDSIFGDDKTELKQPEDGPNPTRGEKVRDTRSPDRPRDKVKLDTTTTHDGVLNYTAEFNPSVVPFKRSASYDVVRADFTLGLRDATLSRVRLSRGNTPPNRDAFWGSMMLRLTPGKALAIPSVGPAARILSYRANPPKKLRFFVNSAETMWVSSAKGGRFRLVFLTDAPRAYFSPAIPAHVTTADLPPGLRPTLPANVARAAARVLRRIKVRPGQPLSDQLNGLVAYFRSFSAGKLKRRFGNVYLDIALGQRGVCRHRSHAFVITAQALGIPARYVHNEAHAFAEAFVPRTGWVRVDLGGASSELRVHNAEKRVVHEPGDDPFPKPSRYGQSYTRSGGRVSGLSDEQRGRDGHSGRRRTPLRMLRGRTGPAASEDAPADDAQHGDPAQTAPTKPTQATPAAPLEPAPPPRVAVDLGLTSGDSVVFRGRPVRIAGQLSHNRRGVPGLVVEVMLMKSRHHGYTIGTLVTDKNGRFSGKLRVPRDVPVGNYGVLATFSGNQQYRHATSR